MPSRDRAIIREERKQRVIDALTSGADHLTAAEIATRCGWPVAVATRVIAALVLHQRLRVAGHERRHYARSTKDVAIYSVPQQELAELPGWLRGF